MSGFLERITRLAGRGGGAAAEPQQPTSEFPAAAGERATSERPAGGPAAGEQATAEQPPVPQEATGQATAEQATIRISATPPPSAAETGAAGADAPAAAGQAAEEDEAEPAGPGFRERGRLRRRARHLRRVRNLALRDLGGLVFDMHRFGPRREDLVTAKVDALRGVDRELRALERALDERGAMDELREPGIGGLCPSCGALYGSEARYCAACGTALAKP